MAGQKEVPKQTFAKKLKKGENSLCKGTISLQPNSEVFMIYM
jgi:hypothetical protein